MTPMGKLIHQMYNNGEKVIESDTFCGLNYLVKDGQIVLMSDKNGMFSFSFEIFDDLFQEIKDIREVWGNIKTKKCYLSGIRRDRRGKRK